MEYRDLESELVQLLNKNPQKYYELMNKVKSNSNNTERLIDGRSLDDYYSSLTIIQDWIDKSLDEIRNHLSVIQYPLYIHLYLKLIGQGKYQDAKRFFIHFEDKFQGLSNELAEFKLIEDPVDFNSPLISSYLKNKVHIYVPKNIFDFFLHYINTNNLVLVLEIINKHFQNSSLLSKIKDNNFVLLNLSGEEVDRINCNTSIYTSKIKKDTDLNFKSTKRLKGEKNLLSKVIIPIPEQYFDISPLDNTMIKVDKENPPSIGCFTILNTNNKMNCCDISTDGSIVAAGLNDGNILVWILDNEFPNEVNEELINRLIEYKESNYSKIIKGGEINIASILNMDPNSKKKSKRKPKGKDTNQDQVDVEMEEDSEDNDKGEPTLAYEDIIKKYRVIELKGHTEAVYSISLSPDNKYLISGSFDETIRLWSLLLRSTLVVYKGHFSPVLSVKFSPFW